MNYNGMTSEQLVAHWKAIKLDIDRLLVQIVKAEKNVSSLQGRTPDMPVNELSAMLIDSNVDTDGLKAALLPQNTPAAREAYRELCVTLKTFEGAKNSILFTMAGVRAEAEKLVDMHLPIKQCIIENLDKRSADDAKPVLFSSDDHQPNPFRKDLMGHFPTWIGLAHQVKSADLHLRLELEKYQHSQIAMLLAPDDAVFMRHVEQNQLEMKGELGHIALARLNQIAMSNDESIRNAAINLLKRDETKELFQYDREALIREVVKLLYHAKATSSRKVVWLGTAGVINHHLHSKLPTDIRKTPAVYLNCADDQWSWGLNRAYLQIAAFKGFEFELLEVQYPQIKDTMARGTTAELFVQLAVCIAPVNSNASSHSNQYDRGVRPSASAEEYILLKLLDYKLTVIEGRLVFNIQLDVHSPLRRKASTSTSLKRSHSWENLQAPAQQHSNGQNRFNPFVAPLPSPVIRSQPNLLNDAVALELAHTQTISQERSKVIRRANSLLGEEGSSSASVAQVLSFFGRSASVFDPFEPNAQAGMPAALRETSQSNIVANKAKKGLF